MSTAGPNAPTATDDVADGGSRSWTNDANITDQDSDEAYAGTSSSYRTNSLIGKMFGFAVAAEATITGIKVEISKWCDYNDTKYATDYYVQLIKSGSTRVGDNKADTETKWRAAPGLAYTTYGGEGDLWGTTWTPSEINHADFGVAMQANVVTTSTNFVYTQSYRVTVYYSLGPAIPVLMNQYRQRR